MHLLIARHLSAIRKTAERDRTHAEVGQIGAWLADISQAMEAKTK
jgi:hypothetical protein